MNINGALVIGYSTPITGPYTTVEISPPDSLAGVEFMTYEAGGGKRYSPTIKVGYEKYTDMVAQMIALYGQPTKQLGDTYQWIAESGDFKLSMTYDKDIFHCMAIGVNR